MKKKLQEILNDSNLLHASKDAVLFFGALEVANVISSTTFKFDLNVFRTFEHFAIGAFAGAFAYRRMGGGFKGVAYGLMAATGYNVVWESMEPYIHNYNGESLWDTTSDIVSVYGGSISSFFLEKFKSDLSKSIPPAAQK